MPQGGLWYPGGCGGAVAISGGTGCPERGWMSLQTAKVRLDGAMGTAGAVAVAVHCREWHRAAFGGPFQPKPFHDSTRRKIS